MNRIEWIPGRFPLPASQSHVTSDEHMQQSPSWLGPHERAAKKRQWLEELVSSGHPRHSPSWLGPHERALCVPRGTVRPPTAGTRSAAQHCSSARVPGRGAQLAAGHRGQAPENLESTRSDSHIVVYLFMKLWIRYIVYVVVCIIQ